MVTLIWHVHGTPEMLFFFYHHDRILFPAFKYLRPTIEGSRYGVMRAVEGSLSSCGVV